MAGLPYRTRHTRDQGPNYSERTRVITASAALNDGDDGKTILVNAAAGATLTLPASNGSGWKVKVVIKTTVTSNSVVVKVANGTDSFYGAAVQAADSGSTSNTWEIAANDDTITLNGTTTGGIVGDTFEIEDVESGKFLVRALMAGTGTEATPFSATVS